MQIIGMNLCGWLIKNKPRLSASMNADFFDFGGLVVENQGLCNGYPCCQ